MIALTPKEDVATVPMFLIKTGAEVTVTLKLFVLKQVLARLTRCMAHRSQAIF